MKAQSILTATALALGPAVLGWACDARAQTVAMEPAQPPPPAAVPASPPPELASPGRIETRPNRAMLTIGFFTFGQVYIASIGIAATSTTRGDSNLWIPVVGPWLDLGARPGCPSTTECGTENGYRVLLALNGILQSFGLFELIGAFMWPEVVCGAKASASSGGSVSLKPVRVGYGGWGLAAAGHF